MTLQSLETLPSPFFPSSIGNILRIPGRLRNTITKNETKLFQIIERIIFALVVTFFLSIKYKRWKNHLCVCLLTSILLFSGVLPLKISTPPNNLCHSIKKQIYFSVFYVQLFFLPFYFFKYLLHWKWESSKEKSNWLNLICKRRGEEGKEISKKVTLSKFLYVDFCHDYFILLKHTFIIKKGKFVKCFYVFYDILQEKMPSLGLSDGEKIIRNVCWATFVIAPFCLN